MLFCYAQIFWKSRGIWFRGCISIVIIRSKFSSYHVSPSFLRWFRTFRQQGINLSVKVISTIYAFKLGPLSFKIQFNSTSKISSCSFNFLVNSWVSSPNMKNHQNITDYSYCLRLTHERAGIRVEKQGVAPLLDFLVPISSSPLVRTKVCFSWPKL